MMSSKERKIVKYQKIRQEKKSRSLTVVDNGPLREAEIAQIKKWFREIEKIEHKIRQFEDTDQKLFTDWHHLTFRPLINQIDSVRAEYFKLAEFHNEMILLSKSKNISVAKAFLFLKQEELNFQNGDEQIRLEIEKTRKLRKTEMENEMNKQFANSTNECQCEQCQQDRFMRAILNEEDPLDSDGDVDGDVDDFFDQDFLSDFDMAKEDQDLVKVARKKNQAFIKKTEKLSNMEIFLLMKNQDEALELMTEIIPLLMEAERFDLVDKFWSAAPKNVKSKFNNIIKKAFGMSFESVFADAMNMSEVRSEILSSQNQASSSNQNRENDDIHFESFRKTNEGHKNTKSLTEEDRIELKGIYRKIVRRIHPDHLDNSSKKFPHSWIDMIWNKTKIAHQQNDLGALKGILHKILAAYDEYEDLGLSQMRDAVASLYKEHQQLKNQAAALKENPAWNFSKLKNYNKLEQKLLKPYQNQLKELEFELKDIQAARRNIEKIAERIESKKQKSQDRPLGAKMSRSASKSKKKPNKNQHRFQ